MKNSVIASIFNGERGRQETMHRKDINEEYLNIADETIKELREKLSPEMNKTLEKFIEALECDQMDSVDFYFVEGFKLGLRIGIECMED